MNVIDKQKRSNNCAVRPICFDLFLYKIDKKTLHWSVIFKWRLKQDSNL